MLNGSNTLLALHFAGLHPYKSYRQACDEAFIPIPQLTYPAYRFPASPPRKITKNNINFCAKIERKKVKIFQKRY